MWSHGGPVGDTQGWSRRQKNPGKAASYSYMCIRPNICILGSDFCWDFAWGQLVLPAGKRHRMSHKMTVAVLGRLEEKQCIEKEALGGHCFFGVAHVPAALLPGHSPICTALKPESTDVSEQPKASKPMVRSGRREVKPLPQAKSPAKGYRQLGCKITAKITSCCLPTQWLEVACQSRPGFPFSLVWPPVSLRLCTVCGRSAKNWK